MMASSIRRARSRREDSRWNLWSVLVIGAIAVVALAGFIRFSSANRADVHDESGLSTEVTNLVVTIGDRTFRMANGFAAQQAVPGSATQNTIRVIGEPAFGDVNRDGQRDAALIIANDPGGSGTSYYAVLAVKEADSYRATNALLVGDRIAPLSVEYLDLRFVYNYLDRRSGEPMTTPPAVVKSLWIRFDRASGAISAGS
jgi:hypothetical protein